MWTGYLFAIATALNGVSAFVPPLLALSGRVAPFSSPSHRVETVRMMSVSDEIRGQILGSPDFAPFAALFTGKSTDESASSEAGPTGNDDEEVTVPETEKEDESVAIAEPELEPEPEHEPEVMEQLDVTLGAGGMADTRDPEPLEHEDPRKSISAAPSFQEYLRSRSSQ